ncbi:MAG: GNAT family N-acetyltransferase [Bifidobacteriaceae bacterium]|jgi:phosphinothricin acetyltransferase|nr:GNAT family N-acetyltransferase [Bifidobacteriaceae bacterium]
MHIRPLLARDWADVSAIMAGSLGPVVLDDELPTWEQWDERYLPAHRLVAANREGRVTGWAALEPVSNRPAFAGVAHVAAFVDPAYRGQGFGHHLLANLVAGADEAGLWTLQAYVSPQNLAAGQLLRQFSFRTVGRRERLALVGGVWHDAVLFERRAHGQSAEEETLTQEIPEAS